MKKQKQQKTALIATILAIEIGEEDKETLVLLFAD